MKRPGHLVRKKAQAGDSALRNAVVSAGLSNLWFLDADPGLPSPSDVLSLERFSATLASLERSFDHVVIDTPPLGAVVDAALVAAQADACPLVAREGYVGRFGLAATVNCVSCLIAIRRAAGSR